jgi:hypothetical protein
VQGPFLVTCLPFTAFECGGGGYLAGQHIQLLNAGRLVQKEKGGPVQNTSDVGGRGEGRGAYWPLCLVRKGHNGVFTPSLHTRDYLLVNNSLDYKTHFE